MQTNSGVTIRRAVFTALAAAIGSGILMTATGAADSPFTPREKAFYLDSATVAFVRPGLVISVSEASIASDGTVTATYKIADPRGLPLDREGIFTPGTISLSFIAATIPANDSQYVAYTKRTVSGPVVAGATQAAADSGGSHTKLADGTYRYTFGTKAPQGLDRAATHTIGIYGSRNLSEFDLGTNFASETFNFIPAGGTVTKVRDVVRTQSCNRCHDQLSAHGGSRRGVEMCVLCHTPQTVDPDTGNTADLKVMAHKIHMGEDLPSVQAGTPYKFIGFQGSVSDYSTVVNPADSRRCQVCHDIESGAAQATAFLARPSRAACGACHDDVNFATGAGHVAGPQISDNQCAQCHIPQGELEFDASILGAHTVPVNSAMLSGLAAEIVRVDNGAAGQAPRVTFTLKDSSGAGVPLSRLNNLSFILTGPASDYGNTSFGSDVTTPGYVSESALTASQCAADGTCTYTFRHAVPAGSTGTFAVGIEGRRTETLLPGTVKQTNVQYALRNKVKYFSVDGSAVEPRRDIVSTQSCNQCHSGLSLHGGNRNQAEFCVFCHNPSNTDVARRPVAQDPAEREKPPQSVNFALMVHKIHTGERTATEFMRGYTVIGFGGGVFDFTHVRYPAMSPSGAPGDTRACAMCHVDGSEEALPVGRNDVLDPQGYISPAKATTSACTACHQSLDAAAHALANTSQLGESCRVCHGPDRSAAVGKVHAQY